MKSKFSKEYAESEYWKPFDFKYETRDGIQHTATFFFPKEGQEAIGGPPSILNFHGVCLKALEEEITLGYTTTKTKKLQEKRCARRFKKGQKDYYKLSKKEGKK